MKTIRIFGTRGLVLAATLAVSVGFTSLAFADIAVIVNSDGKVTNLGTLGGTDSFARDINDAGQVVGSSGLTANDQEHAFITGPNGMGMTDLGTLGGTYSVATGINASGQVVVVGHAPGAFITGPNGMGLTPLVHPSGVYYSVASDINDSGQVVGNFYKTGNNYLHAFITGPNGMGMTDLLGTLPGDQSSATAINDSGQVVGYARSAFITDPNGTGMRTLGMEVSAINESGQVVGAAGGHAVITGPNGMGITDLGTLDGIGSIALGINDSGQVVGKVNYVTGDGHFFSHAFITGPNGVGMTDLNSIADLPDGVFLTQAHGINNLGQVIATMIPEPASYALMLAGLGLVGFMVRQSKLPDNTVMRG